MPSTQTPEPGRFSPSDGPPGAFSPGDLERLPTDPAHLFMALYDRLSEEPFHDRAAVSWLEQRELRRRVGRIEEAVLAAGLAHPETIEGIVGWDGERGLFTLLLGLDAALWYVNPYNPVVDRGRLDWLAVRYAVTGRLNDEAVMPGALLPRCAFPGEPRGREHKEDFFAVHRVPAEHLRRIIRYQRLKPHLDPAFGPEEPVRVACVPLLGSFAELEFGFGGRPGNVTYRLVPPGAGADLDADLDADLTARITALIDRMDAAGARIAVLPEGCLSADLLDRWRTIATATARQDRPLRWLLLGSGPLGGTDPPPNRAVLIDRWTGETLMTHDKLERFTIDDRQLHDWHVPGAPAGSAREDIRTGATIDVRDSSFGRLSIVICQDLYASMRWDRELAAMGVSHLFVPIFSKPILRYRWEQQAAERHVLSTLGAWVVVSNSLVVADAMADDIAGEDWHTCLVIGPEEPDRTRYGFHLQFGRAAHVGDLGWVRDEGEPPRLPTVLTGGVREAWFDHIRPDPPAQRRRRPTAPMEPSAV